MNEAHTPTPSTPSKPEGASVSPQALAIHLITTSPLQVSLFFLVALIPLLLHSSAASSSKLLNIFANFLDFGVTTCLTSVIFLSLCRRSLLSLRDGAKPLGLLILIFGPLLASPLLFLDLSSSPLLAPWAVLAMVVTLVFHFFYVPPLFGINSLFAVLQDSRLYVKKDFFVVVRVLFPPFAYQLVATSLIQVLFPLRTEGLVGTLILLPIAVERVLVCYLSASFAYRYLPEKFRHLASTTDAAPPATSLSRWLTIRGTLPVFAVGILLTAATLLRVESIPFEGKVSVTTMELKDQQVNIEAAFTPEKGSGSTLLPYHLSLRTKEGVMLAPHPTLVSTEDGANVGPLEAVMTDELPATILLEFKVDRDRQQLEALNSLALWYRETRLVTLKERNREGNSRGD